MIVGLTGPSGSQKTVVAKHLKKAYGFDKYHAGTPIKQAARQGFGLTKKQVSGKGKDMPAPQLGGAHPRQALEALGVATHAAAPYATAAALHRRIQQSVSKGNSIVVDGIRTPQEAAVVRKHGGTILRMDNGKGPNPNYPMDKKSEDVKADSLVDSTGSKKDIKENVDKLMSKHLQLSFASGAEPTSNKGTPV